MSLITIDNATHQVDDFSEDAQAQLARHPFVDQAQTAAMQTVHIAYANTLKAILPPRQEKI